MSSRRVCAIYTLIALALTDVCAAEPPSKAPPGIVAPRLVNTSNSDILVLDASGKFTTLAPGKWAQFPAGKTVVAQFEGNPDNVRLTGFPMADGVTALWGSFVHTLPSDTDAAAMMKATVDPAPEKNVKELLLARVATLKSDVTPSSWDDLMVGQRNGVRVIGCGTLSLISSERSYAINCAGMLFRWIGPSSFVRASVLPGQSRSVTLTTGYWLATTELTTAQYAFIQGKPLPAPSERDLPAVNVTWSAAQQACKDIQILSGEIYRLPTECEWENAAQAGMLREFGSSESPDKLTWYAGNSGGTPHKVATKLPNDWGIYDIHGNVYEWCEDYWSTSAPTGVDPLTTAKDSDRVRRGGFYESRIDWCRSGLRDAGPPETPLPYQGVRLVAIEATPAKTPK